MIGSDKMFFLAVVVCMLCIVPVDSQTYCTLKFAARDTSVCDAAGTLEENVNSEVYETKGNIEVMQGYQQETFTIFDQQVSTVFKDVQTGAADIAGLEEEVTAMKKILSELQNGQMATTTSGPQARSKRASGPGSSSPVQLALNSANTAFNQNVTDVLQQLQNISKRLDNEVKASGTQHATMLQELSDNHQDLTVVEKQLLALDTAIRQLSTSGTKGSGANLTSVTQAYTQLVIDASVAEQIAQRQFDNDALLLKQMESDEQKLDADVMAINASLTQADLDLDNETSQLNTLQGAEKFNENQVNQFINSTNDKLNNVTAALNAANATSAQLGKDILTATIDQNTLTKDINTYRKQVDGIQSLVTFTKKTQQAQLGELLTIKRGVIDDLNVLKYAFGIITKVP